MKNLNYHNDEIKSKLYAGSKILRVLTLSSAK